LVNSLVRVLVGWLINGVWSVGWPVGPVVWRIGYAFGWLIGLLVCWLADLSLFSELVGGAIDSLFGWLVVRLKIYRCRMHTNSDIYVFCSGSN